MTQETIIILLVAVFWVCIIYVILEIKGVFDKPDEERIPYNSDRIKPDTINGMTDDPRVKETYEW